VYNSFIGRPQIVIDATAIRKRFYRLPPIEFQQVRRTSDDVLFSSLMEAHAIG
jgi:hypothetical protein